LDIEKSALQVFFSQIGGTLRPPKKEDTMKFLAGKKAHDVPNVHFMDIYK